VNIAIDETALGTDRGEEKALARDMIEVTGQRQRR
jgi:hypothetical protein